MPDIVMHTKFGADMIERLGLETDREIFDFGLLGPDPYLFYRFYKPPFRNKVNSYSSVMHNERTGDFLLELAERSKEDLKVFSYLCGFLCHYALDSNTHNFINEKAGNKASIHMAIEHRLDVMTGKNIRIPPFLPESLRETVGGAITKIYGFPDAWEMLREGRRDMAPFYRIVSDKSGRLARIASLTHTKFACVSYRSKAVENMDLSGFYPLYDRALDDAEMFIRTAQAFVFGTKDEEAFKKIIGSRSYITG